MYVIGKNDYDFIEITDQPLMTDGEKYWNPILGLEYETPLNRATIIVDYEGAKEILKEIQNNAENIEFTNSSIIGQILDKEHSFDKIGYSKELKIYKLTPVVVNKYNDDF